ncbi:thioesterase domain-containing protein [Nocardiopsis sp. Huas11]|uniref:thioesterase domain-containing protein n=1 Tax=Nocardiopsis sp. Huas11 TaxID=2183912 RepID=UPI000EABA5D8|nr:thioesterase domain-containing protein [Nocardiopsis sp. Huas11]RKS08421.1 thioesterase domain-containing protein [Nocardiopsis sp. Huas11]
MSADRGARLAALSPAKRALFESMRSVSEDGPFLALRRRGSRPPLFLLHAADGSASAYLTLARHLSDDQPAYGVSFDGSATGAVDLRSLSRRHLTRILGARPVGPYMLAGWSSGGLLALEVARLLRDQGREVSLIALLDTPPPPLEPERSPDAVALLTAFALQRAAARGGPPPDLTGLPGTDPEQRVTTVRQALLAVGHQVGTHDAFERETAVFLALARASALHRPAPVDRPLDVLRASSFPGTAAPWRAYGSGLREHLVPGDHMSLLRAPHAATVGAVLDRRCEAASSAPATAPPSKRSDR